MNIKKHEGGVWVKCSENMPDQDGRYLTKFSSVRLFLDFRHGAFLSEGGIPTHWLKPFKESYVLTEDELAVLLKHYGKTVLYSMSEMFIDHKERADRLSDKEVFQAIGETITDFPLPKLNPVQ